MGVLQSYYSQQWLWSKQMPPSGNIWYADMKVAPGGNIYTAVSIENSWPNNNKGHIVVTGYTTNGQKIWQDSIQTHEQSAVYIKLYYFNNKIYLLGNFSNKITLSDTLLTSTAQGTDQNSFIICYQNSGTRSFIKQLKGYGSVHTNDMYCDSLNNYYLTGSFSKSCYFDNDSIKSVKGKSDLFVAKFNNQWKLKRFLQAYSIDTVYYDSRVQGENISVNTKGDLVVGGAFTAGLVFNNLVDSFMGFDPERDFICTIDANNTITHSFFQTEGGYQIGSGNYQFDDQKYLHMMRYYCAPHYSWCSIIKFDTNLVAKDTVNFDTRSGNYFARAGLRNYTINNYNKLFFIGKRSENYDTDEVCDFNFLTIGKYDLNYNKLWMDSTVDNKDAYYTSIACDTLNNIYVQGIFTNTVFISGNTLAISSTTPGTFLAKLKDETTVGIKNNQRQEQFSVSPNPSSGVITIVRSKSSPATITVFDSQGRRVYSNHTSNQTSSINLENESSGIYLIEIKDNHSIFSKKIIRQ